MDELLSQVKKWEDLDFTDDFIFCKVLLNEEICRELLEILLGIKIEKVEHIINQKTFDIAADAKGVRLDVYVKDSNRVFDIEMQTTNRDDLAKRLRYYQAAMDIGLLSKGEGYNALKESYILFICTNDPFNQKLPVYTFESICKEDGITVLNDGSHKIVFNASGYQSESNKAIRDFLHFVTTGKSESVFTKKLSEGVYEVKENQFWRQEYMTLEMKLQEWEYIGMQKGLERGMEKGLKQGMEKGLEQGMQKGLEQGMEQGLKQGMQKGLAQGMEKGAQSRAESIAVKMLRKGRPIDEISEFTELSDEAINRLKSKL